MSAAGATSGPLDVVRVGYLHIGRERSGVRRYGRIIAQAARRREDVIVSESDAGSRDAGRAELRIAGAALAESDVAHLQWKLADWDPRLGGIPRMETALRALPRPVVVTMHDVFERRGARERWLSLPALGLRRLGQAVDRLVVHSEEERRRLDGMVPPSKVTVIPHFVETRLDPPDRAASRAALGLDGRRVIALLGAMTKRRGHRLVLEALTRLPADVVALFIGAPIEGREHIEAGLRKAAADAGVSDRVRFLGYVDEATLGQVLAATDVGLCPFREMSASGALATWISSGRPIVATDLPAVAELDAYAPGSIERFSPYAAAPLATAIEEALARSTAAGDPLVSALGRRLTSDVIVARYVERYRGALTTT